MCRRPLDRCVHRRRAPMPSPRFHRTPKPTAPTVVLCEPDSARRMAVSALIRKSPHLTLGATPPDDQMLLALLQTGEPADILCTSDAIRPLRADRYALLAEVRDLRPDLPIVYAMGAELPAAVRRASEQDNVSLVSTRDELARLHEALVMARAGRRFISERLRAVLEDPR